MDDRNELLRQAEKWIVDIAQQASIREPAFFLCVAYDCNETGAFPFPMIAIGLDRERRAGELAESIRSQEAEASELEEDSGDDEEPIDPDTIRAEWYNPANYSNFQT